MIIAQKTYKHKVLLLMKIGLAVFMVVIFLTQNAGTGAYEAKNFVYKRLNASETQYFLNNLNALPSGEHPSSDANLQGLNIGALSEQISAHIKTAVEPLLLQEASIVKVSSPSFSAHQSSSNILIYSSLLAVLSILFIEHQKQTFKANQTWILKKLLVSISPRSPNSTI
jgi:hypothetical protein